MDGRNLSDRLVRLVRLLGTDEGFYVLALHSFVEWYMEAVYPPVAYEESFSEKVRCFREFVGDSATQYGVDDRVLGMLQREHVLTNEVRHRFGVLSKEEALAATHNFLTFCALCRIEDGKELRTLREKLSLWDEKTTHIDAKDQIAALKFRLVSIQRENKVLLEQLDEYDQIDSDLSRMEH
jgi:hypothetical protein